MLNPAGVRFGSSEIYNVLSNVFSQEIEDAVCVGLQPTGQPDEQVILFCKMASGHDFTEATTKRIAQAIRDNLSARHVPSQIVMCPAIPYTVSGT